MSKYKTENIKYIKSLHPYFLINWHVTGWCNYHCPYCINAKIRTEWIDESVVVEEAKRINNLILSNKLKYNKIALRLIGGEVSFYNWPLILDNIKLLHKIVIVTNFSNELNYYKDLYNYCKKRNINLFISVSKHNENIDFDNKIIELTKWCRDNNYKDPQVTIIANNNLDTDYIENLKLKGIKRIRVSLVRDLNQFCSIDYADRKSTLRYNEEYRKNSNSYRQFEVTFMDGSKEQFCNSSEITNLMSDGGFNPEGFYCDSGCSTIAILPNGDVVRNICSFLRDKPLGNLFKDDILIPADGVMCEINKKFDTDRKRCTLCQGTNFYRDIKDMN